MPVILILVVRKLKHELYESKPSPGYTVRLSQKRKTSRMLAE